MTKANYLKVRGRIHKHTLAAMTEYANNGHGADIERAVKAADRLVDFIECLVDDECEATKVRTIRVMP